jgi:REP element-mobilizing transposase RayT
MAERDEFEGTPSRISTSAEAVVVWARGYLAVSSGTITDQMVEEYIAEQEGEPIQDEGQFVIDETTKLPPSRR